MGKPNNPVVGTPGRSWELGYHEGVEGLTIRQYFMAHAPSPPWCFNVEMDRRRPEVPRNSSDPTFLKAREAADQWDRERANKALAEWPAAWADAVLATGEK